MNREILFRGKPMFRGSNNFVYGYYKKGAIAGVETDFIFPSPEYKNEINEVAVLSKTVGLFTGLTDKNGVKIFEGDIIKNIQNGNIGRVTYMPEHCAFLIYSKAENRYYWLYDNNFGNIEIIGNMYDNPELLGG